MPSSPVRGFALASLAALLAAGAVAAWGAWHLFSLAMPISETCEVIHGQPFDPDYGVSRLFPLSRKCNATYDLVPGYVNPTIVVLVSAAVLFALAALVTSRRLRAARAR